MIKRRLRRRRIVRITILLVEAPAPRASAPSSHRRSAPLFPDPEPLRPLSGASLCPMRDRIHALRSTYERGPSGGDYRAGILHDIAKIEELLPCGRPARYH